MNDRPEILLKPLKGSKHFSEVFLSSRRFNSKKMAMMIKMSSEKHPLSQIEFAVVVGKRVSKRAVMRNRIKRLMRESLKINYHFLLGSEEQSRVESVILFWKMAPTHPKLISLAEVSAEMIEIFTNAKKYFQL